MRTLFLGLVSSIAFAGVLLTTPPPNSKGNIISSPLSIANCVLWMDGNDSSTMGSPSSGSTFTHWNDKSTNAYTYTLAADGTAACTWEATASPNGKGVVYCAGNQSGYYNAGGNVYSTGSYTIFVGAKLGQTTNYNRLFAFNVPGSGSNSSILLTEGGGGAFGVFNYAGGGPVVTKTLDTTNFHTWAITYAGASYGAYYDGVSQTVATTGSGYGARESIGYDGNTNSGNVATFTFIAMYYGSLGAGNIAQLQAYALTR